METPFREFAAFERVGWEDADIVANYDDYLAIVTRQSIPALLDDAQVRAGLRVLDVATGGGYAVEAAFQRGADATGIDFSRRQVDLARKRHATLRYEQADAESLPFEQGSFDAVISAFGMCHLPNPDLALREAHRVLKSGGRVAFSVWDVPERAVGVGVVYAAIRTHGSTEVGLPVGPRRGGMGVGSGESQERGR